MSLYCLSSSRPHDSKQSFHFAVGGKQHPWELYANIYTVLRLYQVTAYEATRSKKRGKRTRGTSPINKSDYFLPPMSSRAENERRRNHDSLRGTSLLFFSVASVLTAARKCLCWWRGQRALLCASGTSVVCVAASVTHLGARRPLSYVTSDCTCCTL